MSFWKDRRVFITGAEGFVGPHLTERLINEGAIVYGLRRKGRSSYKGLSSKMKLFKGDILDEESLNFTLSQIEPSVIFHLAAKSPVVYSWSHPREVLKINVEGTLNILEAARRIDSVERIHFAGSSEEYGLITKDECPLNEEQPLRPLSPYGVSKVAGDLLCHQYGRSYGLGVIRTRAFNHTGPGRDKSYVVSSLCYQAAEISSKKRKPEIRVGNLDVVRDFTDVRDVVRAYLLAVEKCEVNVAYNIGTGIPQSIRDILDMILAFIGIDVKVIHDREITNRPSDIPVIYCDPTRFKKQTTWRSAVPFKKTLGDMIMHWKNAIE